MQIWQNGKIRNVLKSTGKKIQHIEFYFWLSLCKVSTQSGKGGVSNLMKNGKQPFTCLPIKIFWALFSLWSSTWGLSEPLKPRFFCFKTFSCPIWNQFEPFWRAPVGPTIELCSFHTWYNFCCLRIVLFLFFWVLDGVVGRWWLFGWKGIFWWIICFLLGMCRILKNPILLGIQLNRKYSFYYSVNA